MQHQIELEKTDHLTILSAPYRAGPKARGFEKQKINEMLVRDVVEPAQTEWASPTVLVRKKDVTLHFWRLSEVHYSGNP